MKTKKISMIEGMVAFHVILLMLSYCVPRMGNYLNYTAYATGAMLLLLLFSKKRILEILVGIIALYYICLAVSGSGSIMIPLKIAFQYAPVSIFFAKRNKLNKKMWLAVSLIVAALVEVYWLRSPDKYILFSGMSRNYISLFLIFALFIITLVYEQEEKDIPIIIPFLYLALCIYGIGRAGIISGVLYVFFIVLYRTFKNPRKKYRNIKIMILFLFSAALIVLAVMCEQQIANVLNARFISGVYVASNNGRMRIYMTYLREITSSLKNFIFGTKPINIAQTLNFEIGDNLHSSYLQLHSALGIVGLVAFFVFILKGLKLLNKQKRFQLFCLVAVYLIRIASDFAICGFITDIIGLYLIFYPILRGGKIADE